MCRVRGDYAEEMKAWLGVPISWVVAALGVRKRRVSGYPVSRIIRYERFTGEPASPILDWPEE